MTGPADQSEILDPTAIAAQAAALAAHLHRSGVHWLPQAHPEHVALLKRQTSLPAIGNTSATMDPALDLGQSSIPTLEPARTPAAPSQRAPARCTPIASRAIRGRTSAIVAGRSDQVPGRYVSRRLPSGCGSTNATGSFAANRFGLPAMRSSSRCRTRTVFGEGSVTPRVAFFGEGPGADEDRSGRPFVGRAGQLLTKMIEACKFQRSDVYIFNTVKCRPPENRNPEPDEINHCREYYQQQLAILRPEYIVCLGAVSAQELLQSKLSVGRLRGTLHRYFESKVLVTYHRAYLLRNPSAEESRLGGPADHAPRRKHPILRSKSIELLRCPVLSRFDRGRPQGEPTNEPANRLILRSALQAGQGDNKRLSDAGKPRILDFPLDRFSDGNNRASKEAMSASDCGGGTAVKHSHSDVHGGHHA